MQKMGYKRAPDWFNLVLAEATDNDAYIAKARAALKQGGGWALASAYQRYLYVGSSPLGVASQPALGIWGEQDRSHAKEAPQRMGNLAEEFSLLELPESGHFPELETPQTVFEAIRSFAK